MARARGCEHHTASYRNQLETGNLETGRACVAESRAVPRVAERSHAAHASAATDAAKTMTNEWLVAVHTPIIKSTGTKNKLVCLYNSPKALVRPRVGSRNATACGLMARVAQRTRDVTWDGAPLRA